jgi:hypothetical protein
MSNNEFARSAHITQSYRRMLLECTRQAGSNQFVKAIVAPSPASVAFAEG